VKAALYLLVGLIFGLVVIGIATLHGDVILLSIPLLAYLFAAIWQRPEGVALAVRREVFPDYAPQGTPITVHLTVTNEGCAIDELRVEEVLPGGAAQLDGKSAAVCALAPQGKIELEYTMSAGRGEYETYEVRTSASDSLHLFDQTLIYRPPAHFVVHPRYPKLDRIPIRPPQTRGFAGPIAARQGGTGIGFWSVREYQPGDSPRQINWRLAARSYQELYTNIFEQERVADVGLILDARHLTNVITPSGSLFEHSVRAAAALAENFLDDGNRVSLLVYGSGLARVFPGYGRIHRDRILKALAKASPGLNYAMENLANLPTRIFPARSQIVMISPLVPDDIPVIVRMRARGYAVLVISPDPVSYESARYQDFNSPAYRLAFAERNLMLRQIRRSGVQIVNWNVNQPLETAVGAALVRPLNRLNL
jgi:uncharacterized protein (DUF58 family)